MKSRFDIVYESIMHKIDRMINETASPTRDEFDIDADVADFMTSPFYKPLRDKFMGILEGELNKVKNDSKDVRLKDVKLKLDDGNPDFSEGIIYMETDPRRRNVIFINPYPFVMTYTLDELNENKNNEFEEAIAPYINIENDDPDYPGMHTIQHECAHIIDLAENRLRRNMHDIKFRRIESKLDEKTGLDK